MDSVDIYLSPVPSPLADYDSEEEFVRGLLCDHPDWLLVRSQDISEMGDDEASQEVVVASARVLPVEALCDSVAPCPTGWHAPKRPRGREFEPAPAKPAADLIGATPAASSGASPWALDRTRDLSSDSHLATLVASLAESPPDTEDSEVDVVTVDELWQPPEWKNITLQQERDAATTKCLLETPSLFVAKRQRAM